jgi:hypothetical protein
LEKIGRSGER